MTLDDQCAELKGAMNILGDRWSAIILWTLAERPRRFGELERSVPGINTRTLTLRLQQLERAGLVTRHTFKEFPPRTEYTLTAKGAELQPVFAAIMAWAHKHVFEEDRS